MIRLAAVLLLDMLCFVPGTSPTYATTEGSFEYWGAIAYSSSTGRYGAGL